MPQIFHLGNDSEKLQNVHMIVGDGLCSNVYVIGRKKVTVIDAGVGNRMNPLWPQLEKIGVAPKNIDKVIVTHAHHDHVMGVFLLLEKSNPSVYIHKEDTKYIASSLGENLIKVNEGNIIETELWPLEVIWTPGHTSGGMCLYAREQRILFSGDTVFPDGYFRRYDGESGSFNELVNSLRKLAKIKVDITLAGHGVPVLSGSEENIKLALRNAELWK